jgi:hypothetical protein
VDTEGNFGARVVTFNKVAITKLTMGCGLKEQLLKPPLNAMYFGANSRLGPFESPELRKKASAEISLRRNGTSASRWAVPTGGCPRAAFDTTSPSAVTATMLIHNGTQRAQVSAK